MDELEKARVELQDVLNRISAEHAARAAERMQMDLRDYIRMRGLNVQLFDLTAHVSYNFQIRD